MRTLNIFLFKKTKANANDMVQAVFLTELESILRLKDYCNDNIVYEYSCQYKFPQFYKGFIGLDGYSLITIAI